MTEPLQTSSRAGIPYRFLLAAALLAIMLLAAGCGGDDDTSDDGGDSTDDGGGDDMAGDMDSVCAAGAEEGGFRYWASFAEENFAVIEAAFAEDHPGIDIELLPLRPQEAIQRMLTAQSAGQDLDVDLLNANLDDYPVLIERDVINQDVDWAALGVADEIIHPTGTIRIYRTAIGLAYNTDMTDESDLPNTWEELVDDQYAGEVVVDPRGNPFADLVLTWGEEDLLDYVTRLRDTVEPVQIEGGTAGMLAVLNGEVMTTTGGRSDSALELQAEGAPIAIKYLDIIPTTDFYTGVIADSPNSNAAMCFSSWLVGDGQEVHESVEFKANDSVPPGAPTDSEFVSTETEEDAQLVSDVTPKIVEIWAGQ